MRSTVEIAKDEGGRMKDEGQTASFDAAAVRRDFPILQTPGLVFLDSGATSQKPRAVIDAIAHFYETQNSNIHRGVYKLSQDATTAYDNARRKVARFINANEDCEVIFTRGTTEAINLVAQSFGRAFLKRYDEILLSNLEHHSNIVPWQIVCEQTGAKLKVIAIDDNGELRLDEFEKLLTPRTKLVAITHVSNALGTINDVKRIVEMSHRVGAKVLIDGAQWVAHHPTDVREIGCDFYTFSGHKMFGPTGIGVLWGRRELLESMPPYQGGGDMIESVSFEKTTYAPLPNKFEAGTPNIAGAVGLGAAIDYILSIGFDKIEPYEQQLLDYAVEQIGNVKGVRIVGRPMQRSGVISFVVNDPPISTLDIGTQLDRDGIAVRTGHHCCQPLMERLGIASTARVSLAMYNTRDDIDQMTAALKKIIAARSSSRASAASPASAGRELKFPKASAGSPQDAADELAEVFEFLSDRDAKNDQVLDYAKQLPAYFNVLKDLTPRVPGCMSQVYMIARKVPGSADRFEFIADADADIVRGEIAILQKLYSGQRAKDVLAFDYEAFFHRIGLEQFLTAQRRNGLASMIKRIRADATAIEKPQMNTDEHR
jgi:cysteine desulfurase / selenocysteine lyase